MADDLLLARNELDPNWIDLSIGEATTVRQALTRAFNLDSFKFPLSKDTSDYQPPNGYKPLVDLLEAKYNAPVIITNGAKQGLGASFYAWSKMGRTRIGMRSPYWALIPPLAKMHGLQLGNKYDCFLAITPNNPDGFSYSAAYSQYLASYHRSLGIPFVHDAAYYTHTYLPDDYKLLPFGDIQLYSISKMFGLSGLRLGYIVCRDPTYYGPLREYIETMTVGVSTASQYILHQLLREMDSSPEKTRRFIVESRDDLYRAKFLIRTVSKDILDTPDDVEHIPGMFLWAKLKQKDAFKKAKINVSYGEAFGMPGYVRVNLAADINTIMTAINRVNNVPCV
jgi:aspartate/methionine/tyrosine aminotransferase